MTHQQWCSNFSLCFLGVERKKERRKNLLTGFPLSAHCYLLINASLKVKARKSISCFLLSTMVGLKGDWGKQTTTTETQGVLRTHMLYPVVLKQVTENMSFSNQCTHQPVAGSSVVRVSHRVVFVGTAEKLLWSAQESTSALFLPTTSFFLLFGLFLFLFLPRCFVFLAFLGRLDLPPTSFLQVLLIEGNKDRQMLKKKKKAA